MDDIKQCEADHDNLVSVDDIKQKSPAHIIWSARLDVKLAIAQLEGGNYETARGELYSALAKLELLKV